MYLDIFLLPFGLLIPKGFIFQEVTMDYYDLISQILQKHPETQDDDMKLYAIVCHSKTGMSSTIGFYSALWNHNAYHLPSYDSITRIRRKVQQEHEELRGNKYKDRKKQELDYRAKYSP